jgi:hypothetical protein
MALDEPNAKDVQAVRAVHPRATAMSDYTHEHAWSEVRTDHDEDGLAEGDCLASGRTQEEAWKNAADNLRQEGGN